MKALTVEGRGLTPEVCFGVILDEQLGAPDPENRAPSRIFEIPVGHSEEGKRSRRRRQTFMADCFIDEFEEGELSELVSCPQASRVACVMIEIRPEPGQVIGAPVCGCGAKLMGLGYRSLVHGSACSDVDDGLHYPVSIVTMEPRARVEVEVLNLLGEKVGVVALHWMAGKLRVTNQPC